MTLTRRKTLMALVTPALAPRLAWAQTVSSRILVAYVTRSGNTQVVAQTLARQWQADLFHIQTRKPYPDNYDAHVALAREQREGEAAPELAQQIDDISRYDTIVLGFPIWGGDLPAPVRSFLQAHQIAARLIVPVVTHGGYGPGRAMETLKDLAPDATLAPAFIQQCDAERDTLDQISEWQSSPEFLGIRL